MYLVTMLFIYLFIWLLSQLEEANEQTHLPLIRWLAETLAKADVT